MVTLVSTTENTEIDITTADLFEALGDLLVKKGVAATLPDFEEVEDGAVFTPEGGTGIGRNAQAAAIHRLTLKDFEPA